MIDYLAVIPFRIVVEIFFSPAIQHDGHNDNDESSNNNGSNSWWLRIPHGLRWNKYNFKFIIIIILNWSIMQYLFTSINYSYPVSWGSWTFSQTSASITSSWLRRRQNSGWLNVFPFDRTLSWTFPESRKSWCLSEDLRSNPCNAIKLRIKTRPSLDRFRNSNNQLWTV